MLQSTGKDSNKYSLNNLKKLNKEYQVILTDNIKKYIEDEKDSSNNIVYEEYNKILEGVKDEIKETKIENIRNRCGKFINGMGVLNDSIPLLLDEIEDDLIQIKAEHLIRKRRVTEVEDGDFHSFLINSITSDFTMNSPHIKFSKSKLNEFINKEYLRNQLVISYNFESFPDVELDYMIPHIKRKDIITRYTKNFLDVNYESEYIYMEKSTRQFLDLFWRYLNEFMYKKTIQIVNKIRLIRKNPFFDVNTIHKHLNKHLKIPYSPQFKARFSYIPYQTFFKRINELAPTHDEIDDVLKESIREHFYNDIMEQGTKYKRIFDKLNTNPHHTTRSMNNNIKLCTNTSFEVFPNLHGVVIYRNLVKDTSIYINALGVYKLNTGKDIFIKEILYEDENRVPRDVLETLIKPYYNNTQQTLFEFLNNLYY